MASTTKARILIVAPELQYMSDSVFTQIIAQANLEITEYKYGLRQQIAQDYYCAHFVSMIRNISGDVSGGGSFAGMGSSSSGSVTSETTEGLSKSYVNVASALSDGSRFDETAYGRFFMTIRPKKRTFQSVNFAAGVE